MELVGIRKKKSRNKQNVKGSIEIFPLFEILSNRERIDDDCYEGDNDVVHQQYTFRWVRRRY
jgi:hypothetical protein